MVDMANASMSPNDTHMDSEVGPVVTNDTTKDNEVDRVAVFTSPALNLQGTKAYCYDQSSSTLLIETTSKPLKKSMPKRNWALIKARNPPPALMAWQFYDHLLHVRYACEMSEDGSAELRALLSFSEQKLCSTIEKQFKGATVIEVANLIEARLLLEPAGGPKPQEWQASSKQSEIEMVGSKTKPKHLMEFKDDSMPSTKRQGMTL